MLCEKCHQRIKSGYWKLCRECRLERALRIKDDPVAFSRALMGIIEELNEELGNCYAMLAAQHDQLKHQQAMLDTIEWAG